MQRIRGVVALLLGALMLVLGADLLSRGVLFHGVVQIVLSVILLGCGVLEVRGFRWPLHRDENTDS